VGQRRDAWRSRGVCVTSLQQKAELPGIKDAMPDDAAVNTHVLHEVVQRGDRAFEAFCRRIKNGETPGYSRFQGRNRRTSCAYP
jgi:putative transposase